MDDARLMHVIERIRDLRTESRCHDLARLLWLRGTVVQ
jgi:hypothetical protein